MKQQICILEIHTYNYNKSNYNQSNQARIEKQNPYLLTPYVSQFLRQIQPNPKINNTRAPQLVLILDVHLEADHLRK